MQPGSFGQTTRKKTNNPQHKMQAVDKQGGPLLKLSFVKINLDAAQEGNQRVGYGIVC